MSAASIDPASIDLASIGPASIDAVYELRGLLCASAPSEPEDLRAELRAAAGEDPAAARAQVAVALRRVLWEAWRGVLEAEGASEEGFGQVLAAEGREPWLWVMGERTWAHTVEGLAGRTARRLVGAAGG